jgi:hypothetical protein
MQNSQSKFEVGRLSPEIGKPQEKLAGTLKISLRGVTMRPA